MNFASIYDQGFVRVAACVPPVAIAEPRRNAASVVDLLRACAEDGVGVALFPELALTGYSIEDLLLQETVLDQVEVAVADLVAASADLATVLVVGAPLRHGNRLLNCAVVVHRGVVLGVAPKSYLPNYREFYERRHFAPGDDRRGSSIVLAGQVVPLGPDLLFAANDVPGLTFHVEVCEDLWVPVPPSAEAALAGANLLLNLSGSPITVGRAEDRRLLVRSQSARCLAAYVYTAAGPGESSTDLSWDGQTMVYELGELLAETDRFPDGPRRAVADVDLLRLRQERMRQATFDDNRRTLAGRSTAGFRTITFALEPSREDLGLRRRAGPLPLRAGRRRPARAGLLRGLQHPGHRAHPAAAGDREPQDRHRRLGRSGLHPRADGRRQGDGPARAAAHGHPRLHHAGVRHDVGHQGQRDPALARAGGDVRGDRHPARGARRCSPTWTIRSPTDGRSTTSPSRTSRPACAPTTCSGWRTSAAAWCSAPATCRSWPWAGARTASATRCRTTR